MRLRDPVCKLVLRSIASVLIATPAAAQGVVYWEHTSDPAKDLGFDHGQCSEYGRAYSQRMMSLQLPVTVPTTSWGRVLGVVSQAASNASAQSYFTDAYNRCMAKLGWRSVSPSEASRRENEAADAASRIQLNKDSAREREAESLRQFQLEPPVVSAVYDEFERAEIVSTTMAHIPNSRRVIRFTGGYYLDVPRQPEKRSIAMLLFRYEADAPLFQGKTPLILIINGGEPVRFDQSDLLVYSRDDHDGTVIENVGLWITPQDFRAISDATTVRARLGTLEFDFPVGHLAAMRDIAAHHIPSDESTPLRATPEPARAAHKRRARRP